MAGNLLYRMFTLALGEWRDIYCIDVQYGTWGMVVNLLYRMCTIALGEWRDIYCIECAQ